jgi:hypothetical protein
LYHGRRNGSRQAGGHGHAWCVLPLAVAESASGKKRLILDARVVNAFLQYKKFTYERVTELLWDAVPGGFISLKDLKAGYHHAFMSVSTWALLGFALEDQFYVFACLPFGLSQAPWAFTKLLQFVYGVQRSCGSAVTAMVDDSARVTRTRADDVWRSWCTARQEAAFGCVHRIDKSQMWPVQQAVFLGVEVDMLQGCFRVPVAKLRQLRSMLASLENE